ncbi:MAG: RNA methyltransferase [Clostridiales bacterium]|nr:RNA methyltransferase [Clostridiales bacterium]
MANIIEITDLTDPALDLFLRLTEAQLRNRLEPEKGVFIAESPKVIRRALEAGCQPVAFLMERRHIQGQAKDLLERCGSVPVYTADREVLAGLTGYQLTRGILCAMRRPPLPSVEELCSNAHRVAVLEGIVDATNVGAIFRSAAALFIDAVLVTPTCCDPLYRRAARVSMGTVFQVPWTRIGDNAADWPHPGMERLPALGFHTAAMALTDDALSIEDPRLRGEDRLAIVLGTEGDGLSPHTIAGCDHAVKIPMSHDVDSLNVAAASAVAFWQMRWQGSRGA